MTYLTQSSPARRRASAFILALALLACVRGSAAAQEAAPLKLADGSTVRVAVEPLRTVTAGEVRRAEAVVTFDHVGRANRLPDAVLRRVRRTNPKLSDRLRAITTAYSVVQDGKRYYVRGLASAKRSASIACEGCEIKCRLILIEVRITGGTYVIPIIESMEKVDAG